jgi:hypothetical protein
MDHLTRNETGKVAGSCIIYYEACSHLIVRDPLLSVRLPHVAFVCPNKSPTQWQLRILRLMMDCKRRYDL